MSSFILETSSCENKKKVKTEKNSPILAVLSPEEVKKIVDDKIRMILDE